MWRSGYGVATYGMSDQPPELFFLCGRTPHVVRAEVYSGFHLGKTPKMKRIVALIEKIARQCASRAVERASIHAQCIKEGLAGRREPPPRRRPVRAP
ncbi:hypothetical protein PUN4_130222 [Paraburkholderia unamae]|nr:hypothetical protein PUN4_130222 [Paraburkholderia unamae]